MTRARSIVLLDGTLRWEAERGGTQRTIPVAESFLILGQSGKWKRPRVRHNHRIQPFRKQPNRARPTRSNRRGNLREAAAVGRYS